MSREVAPVPGDHERYDELAVGWALSSLEPDDEAAFVAHLATCSRCARTVAETSEVMASLAADLPPAEPSDEFRTRLQAAVDRTEQLPARDVAVPEPPEEREPAPVTSTLLSDDDVRPRRAAADAGWRRAVPAVLAAAAVLVIAGLGIWNIVLSEALTRAEVTAAEQAEVMDQVLRPGRAEIAPLSRENGAPVATVVVREGEIQVVTHGLAPNDASDTTYVVWGLGDDDTPVALGTFDVTSSQMDLRTVGSSRTGLDDFTAYGISLEPGREAPPAPTDIVARGQVTS